MDINNEKISRYMIELKVAEEFWDFLGGQGAYEGVLDCFESAGRALRPEIDDYFRSFEASF